MRVKIKTILPKLIFRLENDNVINLNPKGERFEIIKKSFLGEDEDGWPYKVESESLGFFKPSECLKVLKENKVNLNNEAVKFFENWW